MPPTSRSLLLQSIIRRNASFGTSFKSSANQPTLKNVTKTKVPSQPSRTSKPKAEVPDTSSAQPQHPHHGFFPRIHYFLQNPRYRHFRRGIVVTPVLVLGILHIPYEIFPVNGQSMSPFLNTNSTDELPTTDRILVRKWVSVPAQDNHSGRREIGLNEENSGQFQRGQIVVFSTPHQPTKIAVKRIVALPGDLVQPLAGYSGGDDPVVVPWNHVWVEGDAGRRSESMDSNWYGPISQNLIMGEMKAVLPSWFKWTWIDWRQHTWPARAQGRVEEDAIMQAAVDPDAVNYSSGWRNGSIALILERMKSQPEKVLFAFVNDPKTRHETRRLYNNALYVADVATSEQEKQLAKDLLAEMEDVYGRESLIFGIRLKREARDRGELPHPGKSKMGESLAKDPAATEAERWLRKQGWELEKAVDGTVKTQ